MNLRGKGAHGGRDGFYPRPYAQKGRVALSRNKTLKSLIVSRTTLSGFTPFVTLFSIQFLNRVRRAKRESALNT